MANSKFAYVRNFEIIERLLPQTWIVVRIDGRGFHNFTDVHKFAKPNDVRGLNLMNRAAAAVLDNVPDIILGYGQSDEYSFLIHKHSTLFSRRADKIISTIVSTFTGAYVLHWPKFFHSDSTANTTSTHTPLLSLPTFDGRAIAYPNLNVVKDYFSWRQTDCHINNLYNTTFHALCTKHTTAQAKTLLDGTLSKDKHEILFSQFDIRYGNEPEMYKKGSVVLKVKDPPKGAEKSTISHIDIIKDQFWQDLNISDQ